MKNKTKCKLIGGATVVTVATTSVLVTNNKINKLEEENTKLKSQIEVQERDENLEILNTTFEELKEINAKCTKLVVYEAEAKGYSKTIKDDALIDLEARLDTSYSYYSTIDLSEAKILRSDDKIMVVVDLSQIKLGDISIAPMDIKYDLNLFNRWKGKTQAELTGSIIALASDDIERHVNKDFNENINLIQARAKSKIYSLYTGIPVEVIFTGENN
jgi:hypothetical protein